MVRSIDTLIRKTCSQDSEEHVSTLVQGLATALNTADNRAHGNSAAIAELTRSSMVQRGERHWIRTARTKPSARNKES